MVDIVDKATRSRMMSGIRGKNTQPELLIRRCLHRRGFRYLLHSGTLPGKPDLVFPKFKAVIYVHGCFWHAHECDYFKLPSSNRAFWRKKIKANVERDRRKIIQIRQLGWRSLVIWECAIRTALKSESSVLCDIASAWIKKSQEPYLELRGRHDHGISGRHKTARAL